MEAPARPGRLARFTARASSEQRYPRAAVLFTAMLARRQVLALRLSQLIVGMCGNFS